MLFSVIKDVGIKEICGEGSLFWNFLIFCFKVFWKFSLVDLVLLQPHPPHPLSSGHLRVTNLFGLDIFFVTSWTHRLCRTCHSRVQEGYAGWNNQHNIHLIFQHWGSTNPRPLDCELSALTTRPWLFTLV